MDSESDEEELVMFYENELDTQYIIIENDTVYKNLNVVKYILGIDDFKNLIEDSSSDCSVCLSSIKLGDNISKYKNCFHSFHTTCIEPWLKEKKVCAACPKCRDWRLKEIFDKIKEQTTWENLSVMDKVLLFLKDSRRRNIL